MKRSMAVSVCLTGALCVAAFQNALSQEYPARPLRVLSTFSPGSVADGAIRLVAEKMTLTMGQPVVVDAQAGAGGVIAAQAMVRSAPDGYTLLHSAPSTVLSAPFLQKNPPYHPLKDFTFITRIATANIAMFAAVSLPVGTVKELIDYVRANPGKLAYGSNGVGATQHLEMELIKQRYNLDITHVPYKGGQLSLNAVAAGQLPMAFAPAASALAQARAGKVKILAMMSVERSAGFPDLPSMGEQLPEYEKVPTSNEMVGPAGIPAPVLRRLYTEIANAIKTPEVIERLKKIGFEPVGYPPEQHAAQMKRDMEIFAKGRVAARIEAQ